MKLMPLILLMVVSLNGIQTHFIPSGNSGDIVAYSFPGKTILRSHSIQNRDVLINWIGEKEASHITFKYPLKANFSFFIGRDSEGWANSVNSYAQVVFHEVYPGVHRVITAKNGGRISISWIVEPGADPRFIKFSIDGSGFQVNGDTIKAGNLEITNFKAYQGSTEIPLKLVQDDSIFRFEVMNYDPNEVLVIDPDLTMLYASTFIGEGGFENVEDIVVSGRYIYIVGTTDSSDFPVTQGAYDRSHNGQEDIFVAKLTRELDTLVAATFLGGSSPDYPSAIGINSLGQIVVAGVTASMDFPVQSAALPFFSGISDGFVSILSSDLQSLVASTFLGGSQGDNLTDMEIGPGDTIYVCGTTYSSDFPVSTYGYQRSYRGNGDGFVTVLESDVSNIVASTYIGGTSTDELNGITLGEIEDIYVVGTTFSTDIPISASAFDRNNGGQEAYIANFSSDLQTLYDATYFGSTNTSEARPTVALDVDYMQFPAFNISGKVLVGGYTSVPSLPIINGFDDIMNGNQDGFVAVFEPALDSLVASTFIGGYGYMDEVVKVKRGNTIFPEIVVAGNADSGGFWGPQNIIPYDPTYSGGGDAFVYKLTWDLDTILGFSFYGADDYDELNSVLSKDSTIYLVGNSSSSRLPMNNGFDQQMNGAGDGFVAALNQDTASPSRLEEGIKPPVSVIAPHWIYPDKIVLRMSSADYVGVTVIGVDGRKYLEKSFGVLPEGTHTLTIPEIKSGLNLMIVRIGGESFTLKAVKF